MEPLLVTGENQSLFLPVLVNDYESFMMMMSRQEICPYFCQILIKKNLSYLSSAKYWWNSSSCISAQILSILVKRSCYISAKYRHGGLLQGNWGDDRGDCSGVNNTYDYEGNQGGVQVKVNPNKNIIWNLILNICSSLVCVQIIWPKLYFRYSSLGCDAITNSRQWPVLP